MERSHAFLNSYGMNLNSQELNTKRVNEHKEFKARQFSISQLNFNIFKLEISTKTLGKNLLTFYKVMALGELFHIGK